MKKKVSKDTLARLEELNKHLNGPDRDLWWQRLENMLKDPPKKNTDLRFKQETSVVINDNHYPYFHKLIITTVFNLGLEKGGSWKQIVEKVQSSKTMGRCEGRVAVDFARKGGIPEGKLIIPVRAHNFDCVIAPALENPWDSHTWFEYTVKPSKFFPPTEMLLFEEIHDSEDREQETGLVQETELVDLLSVI